MKYIFVEFLGVFSLVFYRTLTNIIIDKEDEYNTNNALSTGILIIIFSVLAEGHSNAHFNPVITITENMWERLSIGKTIGYLGAQLIGCLSAVSILSLLVPYEGYFDRENLFLGVKKIYPESDFTSVLTIELLGTMFIYLGYIYFSELKTRSIQENLTNRTVYYGVLATALCFATYELTGGAFNLALLLGGIIFENVLDYRYVGLFIGSLLGALIARLLHY